MLFDFETLVEEDFLLYFYHYEGLILLEKGGFLEASKKLF